MDHSPSSSRRPVIMTLSFYYYLNSVFCEQCYAIIVAQLSEGYECTGFEVVDEESMLGC